MRPPERAVVAVEDATDALDAASQALARYLHDRQVVPAAVGSLVRGIAVRPLDLGFLVVLNSAPDDGGDFHTINEVLDY